MSDIGIIETPKKKPVATMPGAVEINQPKMTPGNNVSPAPNIKQTNAPNVDGGKAGFSSVTSALQDVTTSKLAELSAGQDAAKANASVDHQATEQITGLTTDTINALNNINRANKLPGGADGKIAKMFSIFDSSYNVEASRTAIMINKARADQVAATAAGIKEQNNALPLLLGKMSEATQAIFNAQKDANKLAIEQGTLDTQRRNTEIAATHLRLDMNKEAREASEFKIRSMTTAQIEAELPRAQAGKGAFAGKAGLLQQRLIQEKSAEASLQKLQLDVADGNRESFNKNGVDFVSHMPVDMVSGLLAQAKAKGAPLVSFPTGEKGKTIDIPYNLVEEGLVKSAGDRDAVNKVVSADLAERMQIIPNITNIMRGSNAFASMDPRASQLNTKMAEVMKHMDPNNPDSVRQTGLMIEGYKKELEDIGKDAASRMTSPDAKGAMISAAKNGGKFDRTGGAAVVGDSVQIPSMGTNSYFKNAWNELRIAVANKAATASNGGMAQASVKDTSDAQSMLAMFTAKPGGKQKVSQITDELFTDPTKVAAIRDQMKATMKGDGVFQSLTQLANGKEANPFWRNILSNIDQFKENGSISYNKMFEAMEHARILSHGKMDFSQTFFQGLQNYAMNADNASGVNPGYTVQDHALEAAIFGDSPVSSVLGELHFTLKQVAVKARQEMSERIKQDLSGQTQRVALSQTAFAHTGLDQGMGDPLIDPTGKKAEKIFSKTGLDLNTVPSATGTGLSVAQIQAIYGAGK